MGLSVLWFFSFVPFVFWLCLFHLAIAHFASSRRPLCHDDERSALLQFRDSHITNDFEASIDASCDPSVSRKVASWNLGEHNSDCCFWHGVKCNKEAGHVIRLDLTSSCLSGTIDTTSTLFRLVHLEWLNLAYNNFSFSEIPATINNLSKLSHLNLSTTYFTRQIPPELLELPDLVSLDLSNNVFYTLPENETHYLELREPSLQGLVEKLTNLKVLNLDNVYISSPMPHILANLSSLTYLSLKGCQLQGEFPTKIFQLPNLSFLQVSENDNLTGYLPEFEGSSSLTALAIGGCSFSGTVPSSLGNLTSLVSLDFSLNSFFGELPISIGNLGALKELRLMGCNFSGQISSSLGNLTQLTYLDLSHSLNKFSGQNSSSLSWIAKNTNLMFLYLSDLNLVGEIPFWLMNLTQLICLDMSQNQLTGSIPSSLMNINQLRFLNLQSNLLSGQIPSKIRNLTQLVELDISLNSLQGSVPNTIFELKNLQYLKLHSNKLSGTVELGMFLSQFISLEVLILSSNNFSVSNANVDTNFQKLRIIGLRSCNLLKFPNFLRNQDRLFGLDLSSNKISGQIPGWFLNITTLSLQYLNLSHNLFTGFEHHPIVLPRSIIILDLRFNKLQGPLPIPSASMSIHLVSNNNLIGEISQLICKSKNLHTLDLSNNKLGGVLPQCLFNFSDTLSILALQNNKFHGSIPQTFMNGTNLRMIDLSNNKLQGRIPRSLVSCTKLEYLHLGNNHITDVFPSRLGILQELKVLILKSNRLHGVIREPMVNFEFPRLHVIDLSHNMFRGELPKKYFESWNAMKIVDVGQLTYMHDESMIYAAFDFLVNLDYAYSMTISNKGIELNYGKISNMFNDINLSGNKFVGEIPTCIASLRGLNNLNLSHNNLEGHIPSSLSNLTVLESLDFSNNRLSGEIPQQLAKITFLEVFNVSYNHLTGPIPIGNQFDSFEKSSFYGNLGLCGKILSKDCEMSKDCENFEPLKKKDEDSKSPFVLVWKILLMGYVGGLIVGVVLGKEFYTRKKEWLVKISFGMQGKKEKNGMQN